MLAVPLREVQPRTRVEVHFSGIATPARQDWIGLYRIGAPHSAYSAWQYLNASPAGTATFQAPEEPGEYEARLFLDWPSGGYRPVAVSAPIGVLQPSPAVPHDSPSLRLAVTAFAPSDPVRVAFTAPPGWPANAWVGVVPSRVPHGSEAVNDRHDVAYQYLSGRRAGELTFVAPATSGSWDLRMHDTDVDGSEVASVTFWVSTAAADVSGVWRGNDGVTYTVRQDLDTLWWHGAPAKGTPAWPSVAHGRMTGRTAAVEWAELPAGRGGAPAELGPGARPPLAGPLALRVLDDDRIVVEQRPDGCGLSSLIRAR